MTKKATFFTKNVKNTVFLPFYGLKWGIFKIMIILIDEIFDLCIPKAEIISDREKHKTELKRQAVS
jgi:hypothetical protein